MQNQFPIKTDAFVILSLICHIAAFDIIRNFIFQIRNSVYVGQFISEAKDRPINEVQVAVRSILIKFTVFVF